MYYENIQLFQITNSINSKPIIINRNKIIGLHYLDKTILDSMYNYNTITPITHNESFFLLYFNQLNVAHSICQLIRSYYEYKKLETNLPIIISKCIVQMPFLMKLIYLLFENCSLHFLEEKILYSFTKVYIPEYTWFTEPCPYEYNIQKYNIYTLKIFNTNIPIHKDNGILYEPLIYFNETIDKIYSNNKHKYATYPNIFIIKSNLCTDSTTAFRAISINNNIDNVLKQYNYYTILPHKITDIIEYIVLLRSAKNIITSYGGINAINRFFFNPSSIVKLICNLHYKSEYNTQRHLLLSIYNVQKYICFLDFPNVINKNSLLNIIQYNSE
jgi:hypothetical protein